MHSHLSLLTRLYSQRFFHYCSFFGRLVITLTMLIPSAYAQEPDKNLLPSSTSSATIKSEQPTQPDLVEVIAQGTGIDADAALKNAYSNAVQQALGLYVDAETLMNNDEIVHDKILTYSKGFIQETRTIKESHTDGLFQISIHAKVKRQQLIEKAQANNITVKAVEGTNIHAQVVSQLKQEQNASALLEKALLPFSDASLYHAELSGEPKVVKKDENSVTLAYPISLYVDDVSYKKAIKDLITVLDKISSNKREVSESYERNEINGYSDTRENDNAISIMIWRDKSISKSIWHIYSIDSGLIKEQNFCKGNDGIDSKYLVANLKLLDGNNELITFGRNGGGLSNYGTVQGNTFENTLSEWRNDSYPFSCEGHYNRYIIGAYFRKYNESVWDKIKFHIDVVVNTKDLPSIKTAKLEVALQGKR